MSSVSDADTLEAFADSVATSTGGTAVVAHGSAKISVPSQDWASALRTAHDEFGLIYISWLSAIDWSNEVAVGDALQSETEERFEVLCCVGDISHGRLVTFSTTISKQDPSIDSIVELYPGADWHEREAREMFGIEFNGHPNLINLYLPEAFVGHPLLKTYPLLSREVKPWPGTVDVEGMPGDDGPSTENPEA